MLRAEEQDDLVLRGYLTRLTVIQLSGFIEKSFEHMVNGYLEENSSHRVLKFGQRQAARFSNLNPAKLEQLVGSFDDEWRERLTAFLSTDERRQTLTNLIGARHSLAHGGSSTVSGSLLRQYHEIAEQTVGLLADMFVPLAQASHRSAE
nr:HEPN domain-containing protein [Nocardioides marinisabuli]